MNEPFTLSDFLFGWGMGLCYAIVVYFVARRAARSHERASGRCYDCGLVYSSPAWVEAVISDQTWDAIRPKGTAPGCGLLCIACMASRLKKRGFTDVPVWLCGTEPFRAQPGCPLSKELL